MLMEWLKKAPTSLKVGVLAIVLLATIAYLGGYVLLALNGVDTTDYRALLNTGFNYVGILFGATATVGAVSAARSANRTEEQTNGTLTARDARIQELEDRVRLLGGQL